MSFRVMRSAQNGQSLDAQWRGQANPRLAALFGGKLDTESLVQRAATARGTGAERSLLVQRLVTYNKRLGNPKGAKNAGRLLDKEALVVLAGQQPAPFGGPMMVALKASAAVKLAEQLEEELQVPVIPVFWNHTEDHDLEEVNRFHVLRKDTTQRFQLELQDEGRALEGISLKPEHIEAAKNWMQVLGTEHAPEDLLPKLGETFGDWSARCLMRLVGSKSLVFLEPRGLRDLNAPLIERIVRESDAIHSDLLQSQQDLKGMGFQETIQAQKPGHLFLIDRDGTRRALRQEDATWILNDDRDSAVPESTVLEWLRTQPGNFSTNVVTRPLVQQWLLPVVAQITGPAETAYLAELMPLFSRLQLSPPIPWPRPKMTVLHKAAIERCGRLGLSMTLMTQPEGEWPQTKGEDQVEVRPIEDARADFVGALERALPGSRQRESLSSFLRVLDHQIDKLVGRVLRQRDRELHGESNARHRLANWTWPRGVPQERLASPMQLFGIRNEPGLHEALSTIDPFNFTMMLLIEE